MKIYENTNVYDKAIERFEYLFDEFENVVVSFSGGKDSTVVLNLALEVARRKDRLPLKVIWIDQEIEWQGTVDYVTDVMYSEEVDPYWFQMPLVWHNNTSNIKEFVGIWEEGEEWIRPKVDISIKENKYLKFGFQEVFKHISVKEFAGQRTCQITGVRTEESPKRLVALTGALTYKEITWGKLLDKKEEHYTFHPIYDWSYSDVWKYIHDNNLPYNRIYDAMYSHQVSVDKMRISALNHETSLKSLLLVQEIEPETWEKIAHRIQGVNAIKHLKNSAFSPPKKVPPMFSGWKEYAMYLKDVMVDEEKYKVMLLKKMDTITKFAITQELEDIIYREMVATIILGDWDFTKIQNMLMRPAMYVVRQFVNGKVTAENIDANRKNDKYLNEILDTWNQ